MVCKKIKGLLYYIIYIEKFPFHLCLPGVCKKIFNNVLAPVSINDNILYIFPYRVIFIKLLKDQTGIYQYSTSTL